MQTKEIKQKIVELESAITLTKTFMGDYNNAFYGMHIRAIENYKKQIKFLKEKSDKKVLSDL